MRGIDVNFWQKQINWKAVKADGIEFAMIKTSQGKSKGAPNSTPFIDPFFKANITGATDVGIPCGVFHYLCARNVAETEKEAVYFVNAISPYRNRIKLWAAVDVEEKEYLPYNKPLLTAMVRRFTDIVRNAGFTPMLYANPDFLTYYLNDVSDLPLWLAYWGVSEERAKKYNPVIWQPSTGEVAGINREVDMDVGYFSASSRIQRGDKVRVINPYIYGTIRKFKTYYDVYDVLSVSGNGNKVVIGIGSVVTAAVHAKNLQKCGI